LRYQVKIHTLSNQPREKEILQFLQISSFFLILFKNNAIWK